MLTWILLVVTSLLALSYNLISARTDLLSPKLLSYLLFITLFVASIVVTRVVSFLLVRVFFPRLTGKVSSDLLRLLVEFLTFGLLFILNASITLNANLSALLTTSAVITVVLGFALQATLGNLFEGLSVQIHQPFAIGDAVKFGEHIGTVESLTWRAVAIRKLDNTRLIIPNNVLAQSDMLVLPVTEPIRVTSSFIAPVDVPPNQIRELLEPSLSKLAITHSIRVPEVLVDSFLETGGAIRYLARVFVSDEYTIEYANSVILEHIWYSLARAGIAIPAPIEAKIDKYKIPLLYSRDSLELGSLQILGTLRNVAVFKDLLDDSLLRIADAGTRLIYAANEKLERANSRSSAMFVVLRGLVVVPLLHQSRQDDLKSQTYTWSENVLDQVRQHYAEYMGPVSKILVEQASLQTTDPYHLYEILAEAIPNEEQRAAFERFKPPFPSKEILPGDCFRELQVLTGKATQELMPVARQESEILEISLATLKRLVQDDPTVVALFASNIAKEYNLGSAEQSVLLDDIKAYLT